MSGQKPLKLDSTNLVPTQFQSVDVVEPAYGGLGVQNPTAHCLIVGEGSSPVNVITNGTTGQLLTATTGSDPQWANPPSTAYSLLASQTNANGSSAPICTPVYVSAANTFNLANAASFSTSDVVALVFDTTIASSASGNLVTSGVFTAASTGQWDVVCGTSGGLTADTVYWLSDSTAGTMTATAPTTAGHFLVPCILAISTLSAKLLLSPARIIGL